MVHKLNKETKKEHFPNWDANNSGGKGDGKRTSTPETRKAFKSGFDGIDWSKK